MGCFRSQRAPCTEISIRRNDPEVLICNPGLSRMCQTKQTHRQGRALTSTRARISVLQYKSMAAGVLFEEVNEAFSTQTCSSCGSLPKSRPKGIAGLGIREWTCMQCGTAHDRDVNAAKNILAAGHRRLGVGIPCLEAGEDVKNLLRRLP
jgi:transposase